MPKTITIICEKCGAPAIKELKECTRKKKNGGRFFCSQSCGTEFYNEKRREEKEKALPPLESREPIVDSDSLNIHQITITRDEAGQYMSYEWVREEIVRKYPEHLLNRISDAGIDKIRKYIHNREITSPSSQSSLTEEEVRAFCANRVLYIDRIIRTVDENGHYMPDTWVQEQVDKEYPEFAWVAQSSELLAEWREKPSKDSNP